MDNVSATLTDALAGMVEAAEKAQQLAAASGAAKYTDAPDFQTATIRGWRDRHDSRLEGASVFVPVSEETFEQRRALALWEMRKADVGTAAGEQEAYYYTTYPELPETGFNPNRVLGWVYPNNPVPTGLTALVTWRSGSVPVTSAYDLTGFTRVRVEGYFDNSDTAATLYSTAYAGTGYSSAGVTTDPYRWRFIKAGDPAPTGWADPNSVAYHARFRTAPFDIPHTSSWRYPVVTSTLDSEGAKRAETILRDLRIDPRISGSRNVTSVATDLLYAMKAQYKSLYDDVPSGLTMLDKLGIKLADLERACARIQEVQAALGLAIVDDPESPGAAPDLSATPKFYGQPKRVYGTAAPTAPTDPAIIYARTGGRFQFPLYRLPDYVSPNGTPANFPIGPAYARSSVISTLDYVRYLLTDASGQYASGRTYTEATHEMLKSLLAWEQRFVGPRVRLTTRTVAATPADQVDSFEMVIGDLGYTSAQVSLAKSEIGIWSGEAGLECAMTDRVGGLRCDPAAYKFLQTEAWTVASLTDVDVGKRGALIIRVARTESPQVDSSTRIVSTNVPLFVTRTVDNKTSLITAFYPARSTAPGTAGNGTIWLTPYGDYTAQVLSDALAANPAEPEKTALSCAGVPTDVKTKLEDELAEAVQGKDGIESSFAYYLNRARQAALRADDLGDQLVQQGLSMDMRSEEARDGLEDLCGGVINVGRLESAACNPNSGFNCDVIKLLEGSSSIADPMLRGDAEGLKRCLGIGDPPVNAILGNSKACVWNATYGGRKYPTCVWPTEPSGAPVGGELAVPTKCIEPRGSEPCFPPETRSGVLLAYSEATNLNLTATKANLESDGSTPRPPQPRFMCGNLLKLRAHYANRTQGQTGGEPFLPDGAWDSLDWIRQDRVRDIAQAMGYSLDEYLFPTVTYGGSPLVSVGSAGAGPASPDEDSPHFAEWNRWPCSPHLLLNTNVPGHDASAVDYCQGSGATKSLLCGGFCGTAATSESPDEALSLNQARSAEQAGALRMRLGAAVETLKGISGASFVNFTRAPISTFKSVMPYGNDSLATGPLPAWHPFAPGRVANHSKDRSSWCWFTDAQRGVCTTRSNFTSTPRMIVTGQNVLAGWPSNPWFTWTTTCPATVPDTDIANGVSNGPVEPRTGACGDMEELLRGDKGEVWLQAQCSTPRIPATRCYPGSEGFLCGEALRTNPNWKTWLRASTKIPQSVKNFMECSKQFYKPSRHETEEEYFARASAVDWEGSETTWGCGRPSMADQEAAELAWFYVAVRAHDDSKCQYFGSAPPADVVLDALDLACAAKSSQKLGCDTLLAESFPAGGAASFPLMSEMASCAADRIEGNLEQMLIAGLPKSVADDIAQNSLVQTFPENRGGFGQTVALLAGEIVTMRQHVSSVVQAVRDLSLGLKRSQAELAALGLERDIKDVELYIQGLNATKINKQHEVSIVRSRQAVSSHITSCLVALAKPAGDWVNNITGRSAGDWMAAAAVCSNTVAQVAMESKVRDLTADIRDIDVKTVEYSKKAIELGQHVTDQQKQIVLLDASAKLNETMDRINTALIALQASHTQVQAYLAQLDTQRNQASRLAAKVLMLDSDQLGRQYAVNSSMRARMNTLRVRYERSRDDAIAASYLARRAVEQKLGIDLSLMTKDMTGVAAPKKWVDKLCTMSGINYAEIRTGGKSDPSTGTMGANAAPIEDIVPAQYDYADGYVGDFVTLLENFVEAYRIDYPFQDGDALAVVSLKDEVLNVRRTNAECPAVEGPNLLYYTNGKPADTNAETAWEYPCAVTGTNATGSELRLGAPSTAAGKSPFACSELGGCPKADAQAFSLEASAAACVPMDNEDPTLVQPDQGMAYRFAASGCSSDTAGFCEDLTGLGATMAAIGAGYPSITTPADGIGDRPALLSTSGQGLNITRQGDATGSYTVTAVASVTAPTHNAQYALWASPTAIPGQTGLVYLYLQYIDGTMRVGVNHYFNNLDASGNVVPGSPTYAASAPLASVAGPWVISLRTSTGTDSSGTTTYLSEIWVNGQRVTGLDGTFYVHPSALNAQRALGVDAGQTAQLRVADIQAHHRALSRLELSRLHHTLGAVYGVPVLGGNVAVSSAPEMRQHVVLNRGTYLLSWYQHVGTYANLGPASARVAISDADLTIPYYPAETTGAVSAATTPNEDPTLSAGWARFFGSFEVQEPGLITVALRLPVSSSTVTLAGVQLEQIDGYSSYAPAPYFPTGASRSAQRSGCADVDGSKFRGDKFWSYGCEYYCPAGTGLDCAAGGDPTGLPKTCFYETKFPIALEAIEKGELLPQAGFARGNFNYRFTDLAINVVGTSVKNCELSATPSSCYANNHVLYSVRHDEPFRVRNYNGDVFNARLYPGNIQQAQALLAERYITNPISSADRNLLSDYWRGEMAGRPIDGNFRLRIYDGEGLDWSAIQDIQVVMRYRYWTREK